MKTAPPSHSIMNRQSSQISAALLVQVGILVCSLAAAIPARAASTAFDGSVVVGHNDPEYKEVGKWEDADPSWEQRGQSYELARRTQDAGASATWTPNLQTGEYWVYLWNIPFNTQDSKARIEVFHAGEVTLFQRDMRDAYYGWVPLGKFRFRGGGADGVRITRGDRTLTIDAVRFRPATLVQPPSPFEPYPKPDGSLPHLDRPGPSGRLLLSGHPYLMLGGELENGSALYAEHIPFMDSLFDILLAQRINTVEAPIAWRQLEPTEGQWDFRVIDALIEKARARRMHLSILWFGTYKNLQSYYSPVWVHTNHHRFPFIQDKDGKEGGAVSPFCTEAMNLDAEALGRLLNRVRERDPDHQVVLMVQVENEIPSTRDYSDLARGAWLQPVPPFLMAEIAQNENTISPFLRELWNRRGRKMAGTWGEVFGDDDFGGRVFGSWFYGHFTDYVAAAGKATLDLPMYCNSWRGESPSYYQYMDIFHAAAPHIDFMGPDLYLKTGYGQELALTGRPWNNLISPENDSRTAAAARAWTAYGKYSVLLFASYLGPETEWTHCAETYALMEQMAPVLLADKGSDDMIGFHQEVEKAGESWDDSFGSCRIHLTATDSIDPAGETNNITGGEVPGCGLIAKRGADEFFLVGSRIDLEWFPPPNKTIYLEVAEEGRFENGRWRKLHSARVEDIGGHLLFHFPHENANFLQLRCKVRFR